MARSLALAALRHGEQGAQDRLESGVLKGFREIGVARRFDRTQQMETRLAKMRQQHADAGGREGRRQQTALAAPIGAFGEKEP